MMSMGGRGSRRNRPSRGARGSSPGGQSIWELRPVFKMVLRGYDPRQVDDYLARLSPAADLPVPAFDVVMRGYAQQEVDAWVGEVKAHLRRDQPQ